MRVTRKSWQSDMMKEASCRQSANGQRSITSMNRRSMHGVGAHHDMIRRGEAAIARIGVVDVAAGLKQGWEALPRLLHPFPARKQSPGQARTRRYRAWNRCQARARS